MLARGIIFIDLAVAQIASLGVIAAHHLGWEQYPWAVQGTAALAAVAGAVALYALSHQHARVQEALIGVTFALAATAGMLLAHDPHGGEQLRELLSGQILWVDYPQLVPAAVLLPLLVGCWSVGWPVRSATPSVWSVRRCGTCRAAR